jgi:hypothetical protein
MRRICDTLRFAVENPGHQELMRASAATAVLVAGQRRRARIPARTGRFLARPGALAARVGGGDRGYPQHAAVLVLRSNAGNRDAAMALLADGFDMLEEDFDEERFSRPYGGLLLAGRGRIGDPRSASCSSNGWSFDRSGSEIPESRHETGRRRRHRRR